MRRFDKIEGRPNDLDIQYLLDLLQQQDGKCAISGIKLTFGSGNLRSVSIDRIDSKIGHLEGNIQLTCMLFNIGKGNKPDAMCRSIVQEIELNVLRRLKESGYLIDQPPNPK